MMTEGTKIKGLLERDDTHDEREARIIAQGVIDMLLPLVTRGTWPALFKVRTVIRTPFGPHRVHAKLSIELGDGPVRQTLELTAVLRESA